jgi:hypothetical protein
VDEHHSDGVAPLQFAQEGKQRRDGADYSIIAIVAVRIGPVSIVRPMVSIRIIPAVVVVRIVVAMVVVDLLDP